MEKSKEFKKAASEDTRHQVSPLLKAFQAEVSDTRTRFSEVTG